jgi:hypothetical protein
MTLPRILPPLLTSAAAASIAFGLRQADYIPQIQASEFGAVVEITPFQA